MNTIVVQPEGGDPRVFTDEFRIGSAPHCALRITDDPMVSLLHAICYALPDGQWAIEDLGSMTGIKVNDVHMYARAYIRKGDRVTIGRTVLIMVPAP